jgi:hypothetical protein
MRRHLDVRHAEAEAMAEAEAGQEAYNEKKEERG